MVPAAFMPGWIKTVSNFNPFTHILESARIFMVGGFDLGDFGLALGTVAAFLIVMQYMAVRSLAALVRGDLPTLRLLSV